MEASLPQQTNEEPNHFLFQHENTSSQLKQAQLRAVVDRLDRLNSTSE